MSLSVEGFLGTLDRCIELGQMGSLRGFAKESLTTSKKKLPRDYSSVYRNIFDSNQLKFEQNDLASKISVSRKILSLRNCLSLDLEIARIEKIYMHFYNAYLSQAEEDKLFHTGWELIYPNYQIQPTLDATHELCDIIVEYYQFIQNLDSFYKSCHMISNQTPFFRDSSKSIELQMNIDVLDPKVLAGFGDETFQVEDIIFIWTLLSYMNKDKLFVEDKHIALCKMLEGSNNKATRLMAQVIVNGRFMSWATDEVLNQYLSFQDRLTSLIINKEQRCPLFANIFVQPFLVLRMGLMSMVNEAGDDNVTLLDLDLGNILKNINEFKVENEVLSFKEFISLRLEYLDNSYSILNQNKKTHKKIFNTIELLDKKTELLTEKFERYCKSIQDEYTSEKDLFILCFESLLENTSEELMASHQMLAQFFSTSPETGEEARNQFSEMISSPKNLIHDVMSLYSQEGIPQATSLTQDVNVEDEGFDLDTSLEISFPKELDQINRDLEKGNFFYDVKGRHLSSQYPVASRVLRWFDLDFKKEDYTEFYGSTDLEFEDVRFYHNFAWSMNKLLIQHGFKSNYYNERRDRHDIQYTLPIQVMHNDGRKQMRLAIITISSDDETIYHRYLSPPKTFQGADLDDLLDQEMISNFIYPPLGAKSSLHKNMFLESNTVGDGSTLSEKPEAGKIIFVHDPKNKCQIKVPLICMNS